ncbi:glycosyltransferase family 2 protein [Neobacillus ginsengisoli]|uniref:Glycosyltransferase involved in cell wall biosynthesis n=1 Tax=Neobacillus ginsengisoli TaxID=904295 RepID=A0ABT9XZR7_9BACI|nr:glycosyltransferase family A protein [Neobacillus ginsengisoli]MDQ0200745.1 glycosyltransferase involved in cell wall biosynthesis [Neobacillus ginsengisoli]
MAMMNVSLKSPKDLDGGNTVGALPLVSVVVATYQRDSALEKALLSLMRQTYEPIEIVVIDDNAEMKWNQKVDDIICNINKKFHRQIVYIKNEVNKGSAETRNIGIKTASGKYITFLDDDDIYLANKIEEQIIPMIKSNSDYSITDLKLYNEAGKLIDTRRREYVRSTEKEDLIRYHIMYHITGTDTMMFKKSYLIKIGGFPKIDIGDEFYLMERAIMAGGKFLYLNHCNVKAYVHSTTDGLSSGDTKISGENQLYQYKKTFFDRLTKADIRYIKARHYAVLAFAELRRKKKTRFVKYSLFAFLSGPVSCAKVVKNMR